MKLIRLARCGTVRRHLRRCRGPSKADSLNLLSLADLSDRVHEMRAQSLPTEPMREVLSYRISVLHALLTRRLALITSTSPLTTNQWKVLSVLFFWPDVTAAGIGEVVVLDKAAISRAIATLVRLKLAQRRHDAENNNTVVAITAAGRKLYGEIHANMCEMQREIFGELNRSKQALFFEALDQLEQSLR